MRFVSRDLFHCFGEMQPRLLSRGFSAEIGGQGDQASRRDIVQAPLGQCFLDATQLRAEIFPPLPGAGETFLLHGFLVDGFKVVDFKLMRATPSDEGGLGDIEGFGEKLWPSARMAMNR